MRQSVIAGEDEDSETAKIQLTILRHQFTTKHESWKHENEYRIIYPYAEGKGTSIPISTVNLKTRRIVAGYNCKPEHIERLNSISQKLGCGHISQVTISETEYTLLEEL